MDRPENCNLPRTSGLNPSNQAMPKPTDEQLDRDLQALLARGRSVSPSGFAERVVVAVRADRRRRVLVRWTSAVASVAACMVAAFLLGIPSVGAPSDETLVRRTQDLLAREHSAQFNEILGLADDLSLLAPVVEQPVLVDVLATPGS